MRKVDLNSQYIEDQVRSRLWLKPESTNYLIFLTFPVVNFIHQIFPTFSKTKSKDTSKICAFERRVSVENLSKYKVQKFHYSFKMFCFSFIHYFE